MSNTQDALRLALNQLDRYDPEHGNSSSWDVVPPIEMKRHDDGEWVRFDDVLAALTSQSAGDLASPESGWSDYAFRSGLLNAGGIAPNPAQTQTAYNAYRAAWNRSREQALAQPAPSHPIAQPAMPEQPEDPREEFLSLAEQCGARITGTPDAREPIEIVFSVQAWRKFDSANRAAMVAITDEDIEFIAQQLGLIGTIGDHPNYEEKLITFVRTVFRFRAAAQDKVSEQNARFAIDAAIDYGRNGYNRPPSDDHWLMPYWEIGQKLAEREVAAQDKDAIQLASWLLTNPISGKKFHFAGPLEKAFLSMNRVKLRDEDGNEWTLTAGLKEGYLTEEQRLKNITSALNEAKDEQAAQDKDGAMQALKLLKDLHALVIAESPQLLLHKDGSGGTELDIAIWAAIAAQQGKETP